MKITYDPEVDVLRILFSNAPIGEWADRMLKPMWCAARKARGSRRAAAHAVAVLFVGRIEEHDIAQALFGNALNVKRLLDVNALVGGPGKTKTGSQQ